MTSTKHTIRTPLHHHHQLPPPCLALLSPPSQESTKRPLCESTVAGVVQLHMAVYSPTVRRRHALTLGAVRPGRGARPADLQRAPQTLAHTQ